MATVSAEGLVETILPEPLVAAIVTNLVVCSGADDIEGVNKGDIETALNWAEDGLKKSVILGGLLKGEVMMRVNEGEVEFASTKDLAQGLLDLLTNDEDLESGGDF